MATNGEYRIEVLEEMLSGAPLDPGPIADSLLGWKHGDALFVCAECAGRIMGRGFSTAFCGWESVFADDHNLIHFRTDICDLKH